MLRILIFTLLFLGLVDSYEVSPRPRMSFPRGSAARGLNIFTSLDVRNYSILLLSSDANTLFVGARDAVISLDVSQPDNLTLRDKLKWTASKENQKKCKSAQKTDCGNFIRVVQFFNSTHLYVCGTNAYRPLGIIIPADSLLVNTSQDTKDARNCCPFSSTQRNTAVIVDEELYAATNVGYFNKDSVISRCLSRGTRNSLSLDIEPKLLNGPVFISSAHISSEGKVLVFFREAGDLIEDSFLNSFTVSRVAQVCTDDNGGNRVLQKRWTSFAKSQLVCQQENELQFNILQDIFTLSDSDSPDILFYGVFTRQWSLSSGLSAVCAFSLTDIKSAFSGDYKTFHQNYWSRQPNSDGKLGKCGLFNDSDSVLNTVKKTFLTQQAVRPVGNKLLLSSTEHVYSRVAVQRTAAANGQNYTILYLLTESGFLHKVVLLSKSPHIIEEIQVFKQPQTVKNLLLSTSKAVLFIGSSEGVFRVPVSSCSLYPNCAECVLARDPFCGWDSESKVCTAVSSIKSELRQDVENGNVEEQCEEFKNPASVPSPVTRKAQLNEFVVLPCKTRSRLAKMTWRFSNDSVVSQFPFVLRPDGSLTFRVTRDTENIYSCVSEELSFRQTISVVSVVLTATPRSFSRSSHQHPDSEEQDDPMNAENGVCVSHKSYYTEMIVFCLLFLICICVFAFIMFRRHSMRCNRNSPQNPPKDPETNSIWQAELEEKQNPKS